MVDPKLFFAVLIRKQERFRTMKRIFRASYQTMTKASQFDASNATPTGASRLVASTMAHRISPVDARHPGSYACSQLDGLAPTRAGRLSFVAGLPGVSIGRGPEFVVARSGAEIVRAALPDLVRRGFSAFKRHAANQIGDLHIGALLFIGKPCPPPQPFELRRGAYSICFLPFTPGASDSALFANGAP